jgi:hypothetical protein
MPRDLMAGDVVEVDIRKATVVFTFDGPLWVLAKVVMIDGFIRVRYADAADNSPIVAFSVDDVRRPPYLHVANAVRRRRERLQGR